MKFVTTGVILRKAEHTTIVESDNKKAFKSD